MSQDTRAMSIVQLLAAMAVIAASTRAALASDAAVRVTRDDSTVNVVAGERPVLSYLYQASPYKPCVNQLFTPSGLNILRDSPHDHIHHHALMFAVGVNGISFWEERPGPQTGSQVSREIATATASRDGAATAAIRQQLDWVDSDKKALLGERRTIVAHIAADPAATLLTWRTRLTPAQNPVTLGGAHYYGLGLRFVESMDNVGKFANEAGDPGEVVRGDERLAAGAWCAYTAPVEGKPVTVVVFDHPNNPRPARFFTMTKPFAYLSATINLWKEPLELKPGETIDLRYGVAVFDGEATGEQIGKLLESWKGLTKENDE